jgi:hypothetical protein
MQRIFVDVKIRNFRNGGSEWYPAAMRGRRPKPTVLHLIDGTFRRDRHGHRIDAPGRPLGPKPSEISEEEQAKRKAELDAYRRALYGEAGPPDPGPRSGGKARRIRW